VSREVTPPEPSLRSGKSKNTAKETPTTDTARVAGRILKYIPSGAGLLSALPGHW